VSNRTGLLSLLTRRLQDVDAHLDADAHSDALDAALAEYSRRRIRRGLHDLTGDGTTVVFALPSDWDEAESQVLGIESPVGEAPPCFLDTSLHTLVWQPALSTPPDIEQVLHVASAPTSGIVYRLWYTRLHVAQSGYTSVPPADHHAVATLGAALALDWLATNRVSQGASSIGADTSDHTARQERYRTAAAAMRAEYDRAVPMRTPRRYTVVR